MNSDLFYVNENAFDEEFCKMVIDKFEKDDRKYQGTLFTENGPIVNLNDKNNMELKIMHLPGWEDVSNIVCSVTQRNIDMYVSQFVDFLKTTDIVNDSDVQFVLNNTLSPGFIFADYEIQRIESSHRYRWHHDYTQQDDTLQCLIYLNTLTEAHGGETKFINGRVVKPKIGKMIIFPTTWPRLHTGCVVNTGTKYIIELKLIRKMERRLS